MGIAEQLVLVLRQLPSVEDVRLGSDERVTLMVRTRTRKDPRVAVMVHPGGGKGMWRWSERRQSDLGGEIYATMLFDVPAQDIVDLVAQVSRRGDL